MESIERYRVEGLVVGRRRDGKRRYSESGKQALIGLCQQPGASVAAIAVANGLNPNVVRRWLSLAQPGRTFVNERAATLLPVMLAAEEPVPATLQLQHGSQPYTSGRCAARLRRHGPRCQYTA